MQKRLSYIKPEEFPEWHNNPLRLTIAEMKEPLKVISDFFDFYDIQQFRFDFKEMLHASFHSTGGRDAHFVHLYDLIEKLVEANWLIFQDRHHREGFLNKEQ